jgi:hypothetical protein
VKTKSEPTAAVLPTMVSLAALWRQDRPEVEEQRAR